MTIAEAIQTLQKNAKLLHFEHPHLGLEEAIGVVIEELSKPSLPSTLNEAAENYACEKEEPLVKDYLFAVSLAQMLSKLEQSGCQINSNKE